MISAHKDFRSPGQHMRLFEPETLLPTQVYDSTHRPLTPEKRLMIATLADALNCFQRYHFARSRRDRRASTEAERWLMSTDREWPFSFENICDLLSINAHLVRGVLHNWSEGHDTSDGEARAEEIVTVRTLRGHCGP